MALSGSVRIGVVFFAVRECGRKGSRFFNTRCSRVGIKCLWNRLENITFTKKNKKKKLHTEVLGYRCGEDLRLIEIYTAVTHNNRVNKTYIHIF